MEINHTINEKIIEKYKRINDRLEKKRLLWILAKIKSVDHFKNCNNINKNVYYPECKPRISCPIIPEKQICESRLYPSLRDNLHSSSLPHYDCSRINKQIDKLTTFSREDNLQNKCPFIKSNIVSSSNTRIASANGSLGLYSRADSLQDKNVHMKSTIVPSSYTKVPTNHSTTLCVPFEDKESLSISTHTNVTKPRVQIYSIQTDHRKKELFTNNSQFANFSAHEKKQDNSELKKTSSGCVQKKKVHTNPDKCKNTTDDCTTAKSIIIGPTLKPYLYLAFIDDDTETHNNPEQSNKPVCNSVAINSDISCPKSHEEEEEETNSSYDKSETRVCEDGFPSLNSNDNYKIACLFSIIGILCFFPCGIYALCLANKGHKMAKMNSLRLAKTMINKSFLFSAVAVIIGVIILIIFLILLILKVL